MKFAEAAATGDHSRLAALLTEDAVAYSDGGGVKIAALNPIRGADKVARLFTGLVRKYQAHGASDFALTMINGSPGFIVYRDGAFDQTMSIDIEGGRIAAVYMVRNPEKLRAIDAALQTGSLPQA